MIMQSSRKWKDITGIYGGIKMFGIVKESGQKRTQEIKNMQLNEKLINAEANIDYLSMMSGIDMPAGESSEEVLNQEEGEGNE